MKYKCFFKRKQHSVPINFLITSLCLAILLIPLIFIGSFFAVSMRNTLETNIQKDLDNFVNQSTEALKADFRSIKEMYYTLMSDPIVNTELYREITDKETDPDILYENINSRLRRLTYYNNAWNSHLLRYIALIYNENDYNSINNFQAGSVEGLQINQTVREFYPVFQEYIAGHERINTILFPGDPSDRLIYFAQDYYEISDYKINGTIVMGVQSEQLAKAFQGILKYDGALGLVYDENGQILCSTFSFPPGTTLSGATFDEISVSQMLKDTSSYFINTTHLKDPRLSSVVIIPNSAVFSDLEIQMRGYIVIILLFAIAFVFLGLFLSRRIIRYISFLILQMEMIQAGNYNITVPRYGIRELDMLSDIFKKTASKIGYLINEVYTNELLLREAELKALQAQINPHFLFNTLLCISWNAKANGDEKTSEMIDALSELLNSKISFTENSKVTVAYEIEHVNFYLFLQKARFGDKLRFHVDIPDSIFPLYIPKLCLQPIVENAVVHGLEGKTGMGYVNITGKIFDNMLLLTVVDNGVGMDPSKMDLERGIEPDIQPGSHNIGIRNTNQRIKHLYGDQYGITIRSSANYGTLVAIQLPIDKGDEDVSDHDRG